MAGHSGFFYNRVCKEKCLADREKGGRSVEKLLDIQHMMKYYGNKSSLTKAVDDISFSVEKGEFTAVMGASGTGGHILVEGKDVTRLRGRSLSKFRREKLGFIFQDFNLLDTLNGFDNIALALQIQNEKPARIPGRVEDMAQKLNIREVLKKYPYQMSGGQKQRCACARAMITNPSLILADEPTGALDSQSAGMLLDNLQFLNRELGATILMVTHDPLCASYSDRVLFLKDGKLFHELRKGEADRKGFFDQIIHVIALLGGDLNHVV